MALLATFVCCSVIVFATLLAVASAHPAYSMKKVLREKLRSFHAINKRDAQKFELLSETVAQIESTTISVKKGSLTQCKINYEVVELTDSLPNFYYKASCPSMSNCCKAEIQTIRSSFIYLSKSAGTIKVVPDVPIGCVCTVNSDAVEHPTSTMD